MSEESTRKLTHGTASGPRFAVIYPPSGNPTRHLLTLGRLVVGRAPSCAIVVDHETVSRQHAALHVEATRILVEDLGSANGTFVGGVRLEAGAHVPAPAEGLVALGDVVVLVRYGLGTEPDAGDVEVPSVSVPASQRVVDLVAPTLLPVLILGETGAGKEVLAERIVAKSTRAGAPFIRINCAALTDTLFESELFGHERGAFTGADRTKPGLLESADGGTVLLDEVGDLPLAAQAKLLRVLESGEVSRVGSVTSKRLDVRFLAATNRDLAAMVEQGSFRADLLYRLDGVTICVPPLRERTDEIPELARMLLETTCAVMSRKPPALTDDAIALLVRYDWPGNVRELRRVTDRVAALCQGDTVREVDLAPLLRSATPSRRPSAPPPPSSSALAVTASTPSLREEVKGEVEALERTRIEDALRRAAGNQTQAAKLLGISRRTLIDRMERFGMPRPRKG